MNNFHKMTAEQAAERIYNRDKTSPPDYYTILGVIRAQRETAEREFDSWAIRIIRKLKAVSTTEDGLLVSGILSPEDFQALADFTKTEKGTTPNA